MSQPAVDALRHAAPDTYVVLDDDDRVTYVSPALSDAFGRWLGHVLWDHLPQARDVYGPTFDEARASGAPVQSIVFYSGRVKRLTAIPAGDGLAVHVERLMDLDVTSLGTLTLGLAQIANALADPASALHDSRAPASLRALP
jgi:hypothetical protein